MLRSILYRLLYGDPYKLGYVQAGMGIARRRASYSAEWNAHIQHTQAVQDAWYQTLPNSVVSLAVIGAGRLFDFNANFPEAISHIKLFDADPNCRSSWKRFARRHPTVDVSSHFVEISGKIYPWAERVRALLKQHTRASADALWNDALLALNQIHTQPLKSEVINGLFSISADAVISLNILSQIPIQWQMWVEQALNRAFGRAFVQERELAWLKALRPSCAQLVREHLMLLAASGAKHSLLITDLEYVEYKLPPQLRNGATSAVLLWESAPTANITKPLTTSRLFEGTWARDTTVPDSATAEVFDSLYGVDVEDRKALQNLCPGVSVDPLATWTWHIAPQFREHKTHGYLHRVGAFALKH